MGKAVTKDMNVKEAKSRCMVRGCTSHKVGYATSLTRENGRSIIICEDCAGKVLPSIQKFKENKVETPRGTMTPPPLFFNADGATQAEVSKQTPLAKAKDNAGATGTDDSKAYEAANNEMGTGKVITGIEQTPKAKKIINEIIK